MSTKGKKRDTNNQNNNFAVDIYKNINKEFRAYLRNSRIGMLAVLSKETTFGRYMLNRSMYESMLGSYIDISDKYLHISLANAVCLQMEHSMSHYPNTIVGVTKYDMLSRCYSAICIKYYANDEDSAKSVYWVCNIGNDVELNSSSPNYIDSALLSANDFSIENLVKFIMYVSGQVYHSFISDTRDNKNYPAGYAAFGKTSDIIRMTRELGLFVGADRIPEYVPDILNNDATEDVVCTLIDSIKEPMIIYFAKLLHVCGVSDTAVSKLFDSIKLHILYHVDHKVLGDVLITYVFEVPSLMVDNTSVKAVFEFMLKDVIDIAMSSKFTDGTDNVSNTRRARIGHKIKALMRDLCQISVAMTVQEYQDQSSAQLSTLESD